MNSIITSLISVFSALAGALLGWILNSQSYKMGKTKIYSTFGRYVEIHMDLLGSSLPKDNNDSTKHEYLINCTAINSRQIPVLLTGFKLEMKPSRFSKPIVLTALMPKTKYDTLNGIKIGTVCQLSKQLIPPRTLHEFSFKVDCDTDDIIYNKLVLVAYDEKNKQHRFLIHKGLKNKRYGQ